jgi:hypothetical protein
MCPPGQVPFSQRVKQRSGKGQWLVLVKPSTTLHEGGRSIKAGDNRRELDKAPDPKLPARGEGTVLIWIMSPHLP